MHYSITSVLLVQERAYEWGWDMHPMWGFWGMWGIGMMFIMFLFWGLVIVGVVLGIRWLISQDKESRSDSALEICASDTRVERSTRKSLKQRKRTLVRNE